eukprot:6214028-Pleurochrysis_carterae.AAC.9
MDVDHRDRPVRRRATRSNSMRGKDVQNRRQGLKRSREWGGGCLGSCARLRDRRAAAGSRTVRQPLREELNACRIQQT